MCYYLNVQFQGPWFYVILKFWGELRGDIHGMRHTEFYLGKSKWIRRWPAGELWMEDYRWMRNKGINENGNEGSKYLNQRHKNDKQMDKEW